MIILPIYQKETVGLTELVDANLTLYFLIKLSCRGIDLVAGVPSTKVVVDILASLVACYKRQTMPVVITHNNASSYKTQHITNKETDTNFVFGRGGVVLMQITAICYLFQIHVKGCYMKDVMTVVIICATPFCLSQC